MNNPDFVFKSYQPTPGEKHLGIATVKAYGKIVLRYKIVPNKDGSGFFPCAASYKMPGSGEAAEHYVSSFTLDSNSDKEDVESLIRSCVKRWMEGPQVQPQFQAQAPAQPNPIYQQYAQQPSQFQSAAQVAQQQQPAWQPSEGYKQQAQQQEYQPSFLNDTNGPPF